MTAPLVLVLNCGSSSIKFAVINTATGEQPLQGIAERLATQDAQLILKIAGDRSQSALPGADHATAMQAIVRHLEASPGIAGRLVAVGHRVVHGGEYFSDSVVVDAGVLEKIRECGKLAPLHNYANLTGIEAAQQAFPDLPHTAVFDTAFHQSMPQRAYLYPLPYDLYEQWHVRRYGFHGTSFRFVAQQAARWLEKPLEDTALVIAHLGNGASVAAVRGGRSLDTSMGMTPNEGVVHGTRCGSIDPSIHAYLAEKLGLDIQAVTDLLWTQSGLLGLSGISNDCRAIEQAAAEGVTRAKLALEIYSYRLAKEIAALMVPLGRLDALVFTGGIGENSSLIRASVVAQLGYLGLTLDPEQNLRCTRGTAGPITAVGSSTALVLPTNEEWLIAQDAAAVAGLSVAA